MCKRCVVVIKGVETYRRTAVEDWALVLPFANMLVSDFRMEDSTDVCESVYASSDQRC